MQDHANGTGHPEDTDHLKDTDHRDDTGLDSKYKTRQLANDKIYVYDASYKMWYFFDTKTQEAVWDEEGIIFPPEQRRMDKKNSSN